MTDTTELSPCATDLVSCYVLDGATLTVYYDGRPWTYDVQEGATLVRVEVPSASFPCDGYAASCTPGMLFDYPEPEATAASTAKDLPPTGGTIPADVLIGGALLVVLGVAMLRARARDRRLFGKAPR